MTVPPHDPYWQLRPMPGTPADEICSCSGAPPLVLQGGTGANPLACASCNLEVDPETVGFDEALSGELAYWRSFHECFFFLWLDSSEFENWASSQLSDPKSQVNVRGLDAVNSLRKFRPAYLWWFQDVGIERHVPLVSCPSCSSELTEVGRGSACEQCKIFVAN